MKTTLFVVLLGLLMCSCASRPASPAESTAQIEPQPQDFGAVPEAYRDAVRDYFGKILKDPESARYDFGQPFKARKQFGHTREYGYAVDVSINAKNSFGGYTGAQQYRVFFKDGKAVFHDQPFAGIDFVFITKAE